MHKKGRLLSEVRLQKQSFAGEWGENIQPMKEKIKKRNKKHKTKNTLQNIYCVI